MSSSIYDPKKSGPWHSKERRGKASHEECEECGTTRGYYYSDKVLPLDIVGERKLCMRCSARFLGQVYVSEFCHIPAGTTVELKGLHNTAAGRVHAAQYEGKHAVTVGPVEEFVLSNPESSSSSSSSSSAPPLAHEIGFRYTVQVLADADNSDESQQSPRTILKLPKENLRPIAYPSSEPCAPPTAAATAATTAPTTGPAYWFRGAAAAKLQQLQATRTKLISGHPTITRDRPCSKIMAVHELKKVAVHTVDKSKRKKRDCTYTYYPSGLAACRDLRITYQHCWGKLHGWEDNHAPKKGGEKKPFDICFTPAANPAAAAAATSDTEDDEKSGKCSKKQKRKQQQKRKQKGGEFSEEGGEEARPVQVWAPSTSPESGTTMGLEAMAAKAAVPEDANSPTVLCYAMGHNNNPLYMTCGVPTPPLDWRAGSFAGHSIFTCCSTLLIL